MEGWILYWRLGSSREYVPRDGTLSYMRQGCLCCQCKPGQILGKKTSWWWSPRDTAGCSSHKQSSHPSRSSFHLWEDGWQARSQVFRACQWQVWGFDLGRCGLIPPLSVGWDSWGRLRPSKTDVLSFRHTVGEGGADRILWHHHLASDCIMKQLTKWHDAVRSNFMRDRWAGSKYICYHVLFKVTIEATVLAHRSQYDQYLLHAEHCLKVVRICWQRKGLELHISILI